MKLKTLKKKIRRLEARLQEGPKKLAKLKRKLEAAKALNAQKARRKLAGQAAAARRTVKLSRPTQKKTAKPTGAKGRSVKKAKRKLNLSPERRAQLAEAMKARWAAKRAAGSGAAPESSPQDTSTGQDFSLGEVPHSS